MIMNTFAQEVVIERDGTMYTLGFFGHAAFVRPARSHLLFPW